MRLPLIKLFLTSSLFFFILSNFASSASANTVIYENDFEADQIGFFPSGWSTARNLCNAVWHVENVYNSKRVVIGLNNPGCITEIIPTGVSIPNTAFYEYEVDMSLPVSVIKDRNLAFRYNTPLLWYDVKILHPTNIHFQKIVNAGYPHLGTTIYTDGFQANQTYRFTFTTYNNLITLKVNNKPIYFVQDQAPFLETGTIALQASQGTLGANVTYFDNIKVTDLTPDPTPTPTPPYISVPHLSQNDSDWGQNEYDNASNWNPTGNQSIDRWGCALTSAVMILKYYGFNKGPEGQTTNPDTLNDYIKENKGYTKNGGVIWSYFSKYAKSAVENNYVSSDLPELEFAYEGYDLDILRDKIHDATTPGILKIVTDDKNTPAQNDDSLHFVVAKGVSNPNTIYINDPEDEDDDPVATYSGNYSGKTIRHVGYFNKSKSDLSYIWLYVYDPDVNLYISDGLNYTGIKNGIKLSAIPKSLYFIEGSLGQTSDPSIQYANGENAAQVILIAKPNSGVYTLSLESTEIKDVDYEMHFFDSSGKSSRYNNTITLIPNVPNDLTINFDKQNANQTQTQEHMTVDKLRQLISSLYSINWIYKQTTYTLLTNQTKVIQQLLYNSKIPSNHAFKTFLLHLDFSLGKNYVSQIAYNLLTNAVSAINP